MTKTRTRVKICGVTREEDVDAAVDAGADAIGFISGFPNSPRNLSTARAASLISRVPPLITSVLVTTIDYLIAAGSEELRRAGPGAIQLYGAVDADSSALVRSACRTRHLIRPHQVRTRADTRDLQLVSPSRETLVAGCDALLLDTYAKGRDGGTGLTCDWDVCASIRRSIAPVPLILSGGLRPENVEQAIREVAPFCVDASSGVESSPGVKDGTRVSAFVSRALAAGEWEEVEREDAGEKKKEEEKEEKEKEAWWWKGHGNEMMGTTSR
jgi:phosphoribosylanthranilate isomerase